MESSVPLVSTPPQPRVRCLALWGGALIAGLLAVLRLLEGWQRLVKPVERFDGIDVRFRWREVHAWFSGQPVYGAFEHADYPPATHALLWPLVGWLDLRHTRWLFAASTLVALIWLAWTLARESGVRSRLARFAIGVVPFASYTTLSALIVGQMTIHVVALLVGGLLLLARSKTWRDDLLGAAAVIAALAKPTLSVPLVWVAVLAPGRWRPAVLIGSGYAALTLFAARFQSDGPLALFGAWLGQSEKVAAQDTAANLQMLLGRVGLEELFLPLVGLVFVGTGVWVWRHRHVDVWILMGVTALVARAWTYHREFDDLIAILAGIALLRVARFGAGGPADATSAALGAGLLALLLAPYAEIRGAGLRWVFNLSLAGAWLAAFAHLLRAAQRERSALARASDHEAAELPPIHPSPVSPGATLWLSATIACPVLVLTGAYAWLAAAHETPWLWHKIVHESGRHSLGETILYASHFLREIPTLLAMVLFTLAAISRPPAHVIPREWRAALLAAGGVAAIAFAVSAVELGAGSALRHLLQDHTRDDVAAFGSHWRYHWLSTLSFAAMVRVCARVSAVYFRAPPHWQRGSVRLGGVAWLYFGLLTVVFGLSPDIATDPLHVGHQAREVATHSLVTLPLVLALLAWVDWRRGPAPAGPAPTLTLRWLDLAGAVAIPAYLGMVTVATDVIDAGQAGGDLSALIAAHFFEHSLDYAFVGLLIFGCYGIRSQRIASARG